LEKEGLTNIDNLINKIASTKQINASDVTDEMIDDSLKLFFKNNPKVADNVLQSSSKFIADTLKGKNFLDILGAGNKQLADDISYIVNNISEDPSVMRLMADDISDLSKKFKTATAGDSTPGVKDIQNALDAAANVSKKSKEGFANIPTKPDAVEIKSEDLTTKSVDTKIKDADIVIYEAAMSSFKKLVDSLSPSIKEKIDAIFSKASDSDVDKFISDVENGTGKFSNDNLTKAGVDLNKIKEGYNVVKTVITMPFDLLVTLLEKLRIVKPGAYSGSFFGGLVMSAIIAMGGYKLFMWLFFEGEPLFKIDLENTKLLDTANENCIEDVTGYEKLTSDMFAYASIHFGCAKTKNATGNDKIIGFKKIISR
jgi:hypothetical protein